MYPTEDNQAPYKKAEFALQALDYLHWMPLYCSGNLDLMNEIQVQMYR